MNFDGTTTNIYCVYIFDGSPLEYSVFNLVIAQNEIFIKSHTYDICRISNVNIVIVNFKLLISLYYTLYMSIEYYLKNECDM